MIRSMTWFNRLTLGVFVLGIGWSAVHRVWYLTALLVVGTMYAVWAIRVAGQDKVDDVTRLDTAQPLDERDRLLLDRALAVVGAAAILVELILLIWRIGGRYADDWGASVRLPALCLVWLIANRVVVRRSAGRA